MNDNDTNRKLLDSKQCIIVIDGDPNNLERIVIASKQF
jgi:hypothetical protein